MKYSTTDLAKAIIDYKDQQFAIKAVATYLHKNGRRNETTSLLREVRRLLEEKKNHLSINAKSARPISKKVTQNLKQLFAGDNVKSFELNNIIDETIIGGVIAETPTLELDLSIRGKLSKLGKVE